MTDCDCEKRGESRVPNRYRAKDGTSDEVTPVYPQQRNDECPVDCPTLMLNTDMECVDIDSLVAIPLDIQRHILRASFAESLVWMVDYLADQARDFAETGTCELFELSDKRLVQGFDSFHSEMYTWNPDVRRAETLCELADAPNYLSSGPVK